MTTNPQDTGARIEACRLRLQSVELLIASSPRDGNLLARALFDDATSLLRELEPSTVAPEYLGDAEPAEVVRRLRGLVADAGRAVARAGAPDADARRRAWRLRIAVVALALLVLGAALIVKVVLPTGAEKFEAAFAEGEARTGASDFAAAEKLFRAAIAAWPDRDRTADAWNDLGWALQKLGRESEAIAAYEKALMLRPQFVLARNNLDGARRQLDLKASEARKSQASPPR